MTRPTREDVAKELLYDAKTGDIWRRVTPDPVDGGGYRSVKFGETKYPAHHLAWLLMTGEWAERGKIDHINGNRSDNRWTNLRPATPSQNAVNWVRRRNVHNLPRGVSKRRNKFAAYIATNPGMKYLGL